MGDPWQGYTNCHHISYWESLYFLIVTSSTIGYGDIHCKTTFGRVFISFFILGGLVRLLTLSHSVCAVHLLIEF